MRTIQNISKEPDQKSQTLIQPSLEIGKEDDEHEKEANSVADKVMKMSAPEEEKKKMSEGRDQIQMMSEGPVRRKMEEEEEKISMMSGGPVTIQKMSDGTSGMEAPQHVEQGIMNSKGNGQSLSESTQQELGGKMYADFSGVNIHTDSNAVEMNEEIGAKAFTHGNDIYFNQGQYNPSSNTGKHLLAHELTHTVQQGKGLNRKIQKEGDEKPDNIVRKGEGPFAFAKRNEITPDQLARWNPEVFRNYDKYTDKSAYWDDLSGQNWMIHPDQELRVSDKGTVIENEFGSISVKNQAFISNKSTGETTYGDYNGMGNASIDVNYTLKPDMAGKADKLHWIQTVNTNLHITSGWGYPLPPLKDCDFIDIVTGYGTFTSNTAMGDVLQRPTHPDGTVHWIATTSLVLIEPNVNARVLYTVRWGFEIAPDGKGKTYEQVQLGKSSLTGSFHEDAIKIVREHFLNNGPLNTDDPCVQ